MANRVGGWSAVGKAISARMSELNLSQAEVCRRADVSKPTLKGLMDGAPRGETSDIKRRAVSIALGWRSDGVDRLLAGDKPLRLPRPAEKASDPGTEALVVRVAALEEAAVPALENLAGLSEAVLDLARRVSALERRRNPRRDA